MLASRAGSTRFLKGRQLRNDIIAKTGAWLLADPARGVLITTRENQLHAWRYIVIRTGTGAEAIQLASESFSTRVFDHLESPHDQLPMKGLLALAREFMQEIILKEELKK